MDTQYDTVNSNAPPPATASDVPSVENRYEQLASHRRPYLDRAYDCGELTLPALIPRYGHNSTTSLPVPFQSVGARGVNNLASKLLLSLFPPNTPFFKFQMDEGVIAEIEAAHGEGTDESKNAKTKFDKVFSRMERIVMSNIEGSGDRTILFEALKHVIVTGNALLHNAKEGMRVFPLNQFVTRRDAAGHVLEIILKEMVDPIVLPAVIRDAITQNPKYTDKKSVPLYTYVCRKVDHWVTYQEVNGTIIDKTRSQSPIDKCNWIALRFNRINGEDYGRGYVEEYIGDFMSLENLTCAIVQGSAAAAKVLFLVKPNSTTKPTVLSKTLNGGFAPGNAEDVTVLRLDKQQDFQTAKQLRDDFVQQLSFAFLLNTAIQRDAERVTAEEVRYMAQELEQTLGGFYSIMSVELQQPYVAIKIAGLERKGQLPKLPPGTVKPVIVTGLEALGRGNDRNKLVRFLTTISQALGPAAVPQFVNVDEVIARIGIADGIDMQGLIKTPEEIAQATQQAQMQAMVAKLGPNAINAFGGVVKEGVKANAPGGQAQGQAGQSSAPTPGSPGAK
jgi:Bacteriophage head to tail connecting protein